MRPKKIFVVIGTRPEAIKLAPVIRELRSDPAFTCTVCSTGQHYEMLEQALRAFSIAPDIDLGLMRPDQRLADFASAAIGALDSHFAHHEPDMVIVQGDTTSVLSASLSAFYRRIPVSHVEAGLRSYNVQSPWPEEVNRVVTSRLARLHFAPTEASRNNLLREGISEESIHVTGNTVVDALMMAVAKVKHDVPHISGLPDFLQPASAGGPRLVLITGHRRENFGRGLQSIVTAIANLARAFPDVHFVYPVHLNPAVRETVQGMFDVGTKDAEAGLGSSRNIHLIEPLDYLSFVALMNRSYFILTDSGGIQEEAPSLAKPVLVLRETTERPEAIECGSVKLVGTATSAIHTEASRLLMDTQAYAKMASGGNPFGDGRASERIISALKDVL